MGLLYYAQLFHLFPDFNQMLYLLAKNPDIQQKLREEVKSVFTPGARPDQRVIKELKWLDAVV